MWPSMDGQPAYLGRRESERLGIGVSVIIPSQMHASDFPRSYAGDSYVRRDRGPYM